MLVEMPPSFAVQQPFSFAVFLARTYSPPHEINHGQKGSPEMIGHGAEYSITVHELVGNIGVWFESRLQSVRNLGYSTCFHLHCRYTKPPQSQMLAEGVPNKLSKSRRHRYRRMSNDSRCTGTPPFLPDRRCASKRETAPSQKTEARERRPALSHENSTR